MVEAAVQVVERCRSHAAMVVLLGAVIAAASVFIVVTRFGINSDISAMISRGLDWRQREIEMTRVFPQNDNLLVVVIDGATADLADDAARRLADALVRHPDQFRAVRRPDAGAFFDKEGLLFLPRAELQALVDQLIAAQPMIGGLSADPSLRGLFDVLGLVLDGVARGDAKLEQVEPSLAAVAATAQGVVMGRPVPLSWQRLLTGRAPLPRELRRFVLVQPVLDYAALSPGSAAGHKVRAIAAELGLVPAEGVTVRLTGPVPLSDDQFASAAQGTETAAVVSVTLVCIILLLALRSLRTVAAVLLTLMAGLVTTAAFAFLAIGDLNVISVAFVVLFVGIAVDFSIQFCIRFRDESFRHRDRATAMHRTARTIAGPLMLAAATTAVGFLCFVPTDYRGIAELGTIAGTGMIVAIIYNLTLLPALLALMRPSPVREPVGYRWAGGVDRFLLRWRRSVMAIGGLLSLIGIAMLPRLDFDFDPLHLQNQTSESVATLVDLVKGGDTDTPYSVDLLAASPAAAAQLAARLAKVPEVGQVVSVASFVPEDQPEKLAIIADAAMILDPTLHPPNRKPPPDDAAVAAAMTRLIERLRAAARPDSSVGRLADALAAVAARGAAGRAALSTALVGGLAERLDRMATALSAEPVTLATLPADLKRDWITQDGRVRVQVFPARAVRGNDDIKRFVAAVRPIAPDATGMPISIVESAQTIVRAFVIGGLISFVGVALLLMLTLRRVHDAALVFAPVLLAALLTVSTSVLFGLPINYANIIALPLLLGIGVAFSIYFVTNWRAGRSDPLQSSTARAVLFSALTTVTAFGSLALSSHPGTADMGKLLSIALGYTLLATFFFLPALLGPVTPAAARHSRLANLPADSGRG
jgi:hopanoid biosynthesis associated RND transporter like protein HpnN